MGDGRRYEARPMIVDATDWLGTDDEGDGSGRAFDWEFRAGGGLAYESPTGYWENGSWSCDGATLLIETNDHYADYVGYVRPDEVRGRASNVTGLEWIWWARLK